jgi:stage V sporulation protein G
MINDIKVIRGKDGLFISMPSRKKRNGEFKDVAHPLNQETRRRVEERILAEYEAVLSGNGAQPAAEVRQVAVGAPAGGAGSLEEVERRHLDDSFWGVR